MCYLLLWLLVGGYFAASIHFTRESLPEDKVVIRRLSLRLFAVLAVTSILLYGISAVIENGHDQEQLENDTEEIAAKNQLLKEDYEEKHDLWESFQQTGQVLVDYSFNTYQTNTESIGSDIGYIYRINDTDVASSGQVWINVTGGATKIFTEVYEDDTIPDIGTDSSSVVLTLDDLQNGYVFHHTMAAHETRGRDAGNTAMYNSDCTLSIKSENIPQENISEPNYYDSPDISYYEDDAPFTIFGSRYDFIYILLFLIALGATGWYAHLMVECFRDWIARERFALESKDMEDFYDK